MQSSQLIGGNFCLAKAGITGLNGAATTFTTANAVLYSIIGRALSKAAVAGGATPTVDAVTGAPLAVAVGKGSTVLWCLDAAGAVKLVQGSSEAIDATGNFLIAPPQFPNVPDTLTPFAYSVHKVLPAAAGAFTLGASPWNMANTVHTVTDLIALPNRPQAA